MKPPIIAYSPYGLVNRMLGLASAMAVGELLGRPTVLVWERNWHIGHAAFSSLFENSLDVLESVPRCKHVRDGRSALADFPDEDEVLFVCHDVGTAADVRADQLARLRPVAEIQSKVDQFVADACLHERIGVHIRQGDKIDMGFSDTCVLALLQYDLVLEALAARSSRGIFLSCDDPAIEDRTWKKFPDRIVCRERATNALVRSPESIAEALVDLYCLSRTHCVLHGMGTFGYGARLLNGGQGTNILSDSNELLIGFEEVSKQMLPDVNELLLGLNNCLIDPPDGVQGAKVKRWRAFSR